MAKIIQLILLVLFGFCKLFGQTCDTAGYSYSYWYNGSPSSIATNILPGPAGTTMLFGNLQLNYNLPTTSYAVYFTQLNGRGVPLQSKTLNYTSNAYIYDACQNPAGGYFIAGFTSAPGAGGVPWVSKLDAMGNSLWGFGMNTPSGTFYKVAATADGGCVAAGSLAVKSLSNSNGDVVRPFNHAIVFRLDSTGKMVWGKEFYTAQEVEQAYQILPMQDGSVLVTGVKNNGPNAAPGSNNFMLKLDKDDGHTIWQRSSFVYFGQVTQLSNGNLLFRQGNFLYFVNAADGTSLQAINFTLPPPYNINYDLQYGGSFADGADLYYDFVNNQNTLLFKMYNYDSVAWVENMPQGNSYGIDDGPVSALITQNGTNGSIYICGALSSQGLATHDSSQFEENSYLYHMSLNGRSACTDTLNIPFSFANISLPELDDFVWYGTGNLVLNTPISLSAVGQIPLNGIDCSSEFCCKDTTLTITDTMCTNGSYTLPDGTTVNSTGLYSSILKRKSGCDSIIFIIVTASPPVKPNLGADTCFATAAPIVLRANANLAKSYLWQDGSTDSVYSATMPGTYWVQATNVCGAFADTLVIYPQCLLPVYVPTAFTPNGDGINDIFRIGDMKGQTLLDFSIYNRWGTLVFRTEDPAQGWDGNINAQPAPSGAFVYLIHYNDLNGKGNYIKGTVVLMR